MPRPARFADTIVQAVRRYFGLDQKDLAAYLGLEQAQLSHLEAGRRDLPPAVAEALVPLADGLPSLSEQLAPFPAPSPADLSAPERAPLEARLDYCQHHAARLRRALRPLVAEAAYAARWRQALPQLRAALPPDPGGEEPPAHQGPGRFAAFLVWFRWRWLALRPTRLDAARSARYHLLRLQAEALETEAAALAALLAAAPPADEVSKASF